MKVLFVTHNFPRSDTDLPGNFLLRIARALRERGVHVHVVAPHAASLATDAVVGGVPVTRFRYAPDARETLAYSGTMATQVQSSLRAKLDLWHLIRSATRTVRRLATGFDVVHAHWWFPAGLATNASALQGRPLVTTLHGSDVRLARSTAARTLMRNVLRRSARVTAVSSWLSDEAVRLGAGAAPAVLPMPADVELFTPRPASAPHTRSGVLFVGKLDAQKGARVLLDALAQLPADLTATVVGDGPDAAALRVRAASLGVAHRVNWIGALPQSELPAYYQAAELFVAPATEPEGLGLAAVESLLCETPVVATRAGGLVDVVDDGECGRVVAPNDAHALAGAIADARANRERLAAWGREGRARMLERFAPAPCAARYHVLYAEVAGARH